MNAAQRTVWTDIVATTRSQFSTHLQGVELGMNTTLSIIARRWMVLAASIGAAMALAVVLLLVIPPKYTATATLQINTRSEQVTKVQDVVGSLAGNDAAIRTELDVLTSRKLAERVVQKLDLQDALARQNSFLGYVITAAKMVFLPASSTEGTANAQKRTTMATNAFLHNLNVVQTPRSYSINLTYTSGNPQLSANVLNTLMSAYLDSQMEDKFDATKRASEWIDDRLSQMRKQVQAADLAVQKFRADNNLTTAKGVLLSDQQLSELNSQLILARTDLAEAEAKMHQADKLQQSGRGIESSAEVLNNPLINSLQEQATQIRSQMAELSTRYGDKHPRMVTVRNQLGDIQRKIYEEVSKIKDSLANNVAVAQARVDTLQQQLDTLQSQSNVSNDASVKLAELERQADAERTLYQSFLDRSKELAQLDFAQTDARVISAAEPPLSPSSPNKLKLLAVAFLLGSALGTALMFLLEMLDAGFRTGAQVEADLQTPLLGVLAELPHDEDLAHYVAHKPMSAFAEGIRAVRTAMQFANPDKQPKVILVSSSIPEEGKSLFAINLAQLTAQGGAKVLLVDADMRRPSVSRQLGLDHKKGVAKAGLAEVLIDQAKLKDVLITLPDIKGNGAKLDVIPSLPNSQFSQELLGSDKMKKLLEDWRKTYDMIVIDSPPVMAVSDSVTLSGIVDAMLFMVRWGSTPRALAANSIKILNGCHAPLTGVVLTRVDLTRQQSYSVGEYGYYHGKYKGYYTE